MSAETTGNHMDALGTVMDAHQHDGRSSMQHRHAAYLSNALMVSVCGWCRRTLLPSGEWVESGAAVRELGFVDGQQVPMVSHGICPRCLDRMTDSMDR